MVLDEVDALLLRRISETRSLTESAKMLGISYRNAWDRIRKVEASYGKRVLKSKAGGAVGGSSELTPEGEALFREFRRMRKYLFNALDDRDSSANVGYKLSARNTISATVAEVRKGDIASMVKMASGGPVQFTSIISNEAVEDLGLQKGDRVLAVIKSTEVMVAKPEGRREGRKTK